MKVENFIDMKPERIVSFICMLLAAVTITDAQESDTSRVYNGWRVEQDLLINWFDYVYYIGSKDDYIRISFNRKHKKIEYIDMHFTGEMSKTSQFFRFGDDEKLILKFSDFEEYSIPIKDESGYVYHPDRICYEVSYWENGKIMEEGPLLYYEKDGPGMDSAASHGEHKFYDREGRLIEIRYYYYHKCVFSVKLNEL